MAITYQGIGTLGANSVAATTLAVPYVASPAAGDVFVAIVNVDDPTVPTLPAGWTSAVSYQGTGAQSPGGRVFYKIATGSETGNLSVTTVSATSNGVMLMFRGVDQTTPIDVAGSTVSPAASTTYTIPSITTTTTGVALVAGAASFAVGGSFSTIAAPAAMTEVLDTTNGVRPVMAVDYLIWSGSGATGTVAVTRTTSTRGCGWMIALRPASSGVSGDAALAATDSLTSAGQVGTVSGTTSSSTATLSAAGLVGAVAAATLAATTTLTGAGLVGASTGASVAATATITAAGAVGRSTGATLAATAAITSAGSVTSGLASSATLAATGTITTTGTVAGTRTATLAATDTIAAAGTLGRQTGTSVTATAAISATGSVAATGLTGSAALGATAAVTAAGRVALSGSAAVTTTVVITAAGSTTGNHKVAAASRLLTVPADNRRLTVNSQPCILIPADNRRIPVAALTRTIPVPAQNRTLNA